MELLSKAISESQYKLDLKIKPFSIYLHPLSFLTLNDDLTWELKIREHGEMKQIRQDTTEYPLDTEAFELYEGTMMDRMAATYAHVQSLGEWVPEVNPVWANSYLNFVITLEQWLGSKAVEAEPVHKLIVTYGAGDIITLHVTRIGHDEYRIVLNITGQEVITTRYAHRTGIVHSTILVSWFRNNEALGTKLVLKLREDLSAVYKENILSYPTPKALEAMMECLASGPTDYLNTYGHLPAPNSVVSKSNQTYRITIERPDMDLVVAIKHYEEDLWTYNIHTKELTVLKTDLLPSDYLLLQFAAYKCFDNYLKHASAEPGQAGVYSKQFRTIMGVDQ